MEKNNWKEILPMEYIPMKRCPSERAILTFEFEWSC